MIEQYEVNYEIGKLLMHSNKTADPLNPYTKKLKQISGLRKKTDADLEAMAKIEKEASLYLNDEGQIYIDTRVIESGICEGAKKTKEGKIALGSTWVDEASPITYDGSENIHSVQDFVDSQAHLLVVAVRVGTSTVMRTRPLFKNVKGSFIVSLQTDLANPEMLHRWVETMLTQVGLCDWRPRYGRGKLVDMTKISK